MEPKLRFKEFNGDWEEKKFGDIMNSFDYGMNSASTEFDGENKYIRITDIDENSHTYLNENIVSPSGELEDKYIVKKNDILFARTGASTGKTYLYNEKDGKLYFAGFLIRGNVKENYDSYFVYSQTLTENYSKWVSLTSMRSGQPGINSNEYSNYKCKFPSLSEQTKIADFLSTVDEKIQNQQDKITHLENIKKGFMQQIFSRKIRFKDANGNEFPEWEEKKIKDILREVVEKTTVLNQYEVLSSTSNGIFTQKEYFNRDIASKDNIGYKVLRINQIVLSPQNLWMGNINLNKSFKIGMVSPSYKIFNIVKGNDVNFMGYFLRTPKAFYEYTISSEQGASIVRRNLNMDLFNNIKFKLPCLEEQQKIADFLSSFDDKIDAEKETLEHLKELKKGLLQQMFV